MYYYYPKGEMEYVQLLGNATYSHREDQATPFVSLSFQGATLLGSVDSVAPSVAAQTVNQLACLYVEIEEKEKIQIHEKFSGYGKVLIQFLKDPIDC